MEFSISGSRSVVGFAPIKKLLELARYVGETDEEAIGLGVIWPDSDVIASAIARSSLTESAQITDRIRFFKINRVIRHFIKTGVGLVRRFGQVIVNVRQAEKLDE